MSHYVVVNQVQKKQKCKRTSKRLLAVLLIALLLFMVVFVCIYKRAMTPTILEIAVVQVESEATRAINEAICAVFDGSVNYNTLVIVEKNSNNEIVMLSANSATVNSLARNTSLLAQAKINNLFQNAIEVHLGTLSGVPLLNEKGPVVCIEISPVSAVNCTFVSKFDTAGINQTLHRIFLNVESSVELVVPTMHKTVEISTPILICETMIVGKVPEVFLQGDFMLGSA